MHEDKAAYHKEDTVYWYGPIINRDHSFRLGICLNNAITLGMEAKNYIRTFCSYPLNENIIPDRIRHAIEYANERGIHFSGKVIAQHLMIENRQNEMIVHDEVFLPVIAK